jgi:MFS family permease
MIATGCTYLGATLGFLVVSFLVDNYGRKLALLISWGICTVGSIVVVFDSNIILVSIGLFLSGFGCDAANNITFLFFCETLNNQKRQRYSIIVQVFFTVGGLVCTTLFFLINDWRIVWSLLVVFPAVIEFFLLLCYVEETPHFLIKRGCSHALKALNRIGMINFERR